MIHHICRFVDQAVGIIFNRFDDQFDGFFAKFFSAFFRALFQQLPGPTFAGWRSLALRDQIFKLLQRHVSILIARPAASICALASAIV